MAEEEKRRELVAVTSSDEGVAKIQLAARWAEEYAPAEGDSLEAALARFRRAYQYVDAVIHGIEPPEE